MKLVLQVVYSLTVAILVLFILERCMNVGLNNNVNYKVSYITKSQVNADILVHGPCEPEWMIDPEMLKDFVPFSIYNLSLNHSDFADNYIFLTQYLEHQEKPKAVLLYVTPESFDSVHANTFNTYRFSHLMDDSGVKHVVYEMDYKYKKASNIPFLKYSFYSNFLYYKAFKGWMDLAFNNKTPRSINGYIEPSHPWHASFRNYRDLNPKEGVFLWSSSREKYFIKIIELLKAKNIALIIYESPVYYEALHYQKNRQTHLNRIDSICTKYDVPFLKFDTLSMSHDKVNYFTTYNTTMTGNKIFNPILGKVLQDTLPPILSKYSTNLRINK